MISTNFRMTWEGSEDIEIVEMITIYLLLQAEQFLALKSPISKKRNKGKG